MKTDREKLYALMKEAVRNCDPGNTCLKCHYRTRTDCMERVTADHLIANGVVVQTWIPVTERLPGTEGSYLVYTERGSVYASHFYTEKKFASGYVREASWSQRGKVKVTHWMPLPEPPKEGE